MLPARDLVVECDMEPARVAFAGTRRSLSDPRASPGPRETRVTEIALGPVIQSLPAEIDGSVNTWA